jgi:glycosyltransferase involved in cell wall biosynthesis
MRTVTAPASHEDLLHVAPSSRPSPGRSGPLRVCFLIDELARAGTETQLLALLENLDRSLVSPYLCLLRGQSPASRALEPVDLPVLRLGVQSLKSPSTLAKASRFIHFLRRQRIDVVQAYFPDSSYFGLPLAWLAGVPHRIRTRNNVGHWLTWFHRLLGRGLNLVATTTITNAQAVRQAFLASDRARPASVIVLDNGVDSDRFLSLPLPEFRGQEQRCCVGVVANLRPVKGLDVLLDAATRLAPIYPQVQFRVAGDGPLRTGLVAQAATRGLQDRLHFLGSVQDIPAFLGGVDIGVLCSHAEGMPNSVLEYMAAGRPVVATSVGAVPEMIEDGIHGLLVSPGDSLALAESIGRLVADPGLASRLGQQARQRVLERYTRQAMVQRFEVFYRSLLHADALACGDWSPLWLEGEKPKR